VDDEASVCALCERALTNAGYLPRTVQDGAQAIEEVRRSSFDVVTLDVRMPGMNGPEVLAVLREVDPDVPCVVISGYSSFEDAIECLRKGAVDFVRKPFDIETLVRAADRALSTTHLRADSALLAATQSIFSSLSATELAPRLLRVVRSFLSADEAAFMPADTGQVPRTTLRLGNKTRDEIAHDPPMPIVAFRRLGGFQEPMLLDASLAQDGELIAALSPGAHSILVMRLAVGQNVVGLLVAARGADHRAFGERDLRRAMMLMGHSSLALENARLHTASEAQASELRQAQGRLVVAERVATLSRLSLGLGHEISNPASAILANLEVAKEATSAQQEDMALDAISRAAAGATAILGVCQALRPLAAHSPHDQEMLDLRRVIDGALLLCSYELRSRAHVNVYVPDRLPMLFGSSARLGQVILNLLLNAAQAIEPGHPETNEIRIVVDTQREGEVIVRVEDTGAGVPPDLLPTLFEPNVTTKLGPGHGMGLAVCRWILDDAGGTIRSVPDVERGAVFEIRLPIKPPATSP
jgi:signal transduction histidine kinase